VRSAAPPVGSLNGGVVIDVAPMSTVSEATGAWGSLETWSAKTSRFRVVLWVGSILWLFAAWPLFVLKNLPHQDLSAHIAASYVVDHIAQYPQYVATHGLRTNSALTLFVSATAPVFGYMGAARVLLMGVLAATAFGYACLLLSLGGPKRVWLGGLFAVPFVNHWYVSMGMLNFSLSFGLCLFILSHQRALRERWSYHRALGVAVLSVIAWIAHSFPLLVLLVMASGECIHAYFRDKSSLAGAVRWGIALVPAGLLVVLGSLLAPVHEYARIPGSGRTTWENAGELILGMFRHFAVGPTFLSGAAIMTGVALLLVVFVHRKDDCPTGFSGTTLALLALCYAFVPFAIIPVWSYFGTRFLPFIWLGLLVRVPNQLPHRLLSFVSCAAVASSLGTGAGFLSMDHRLNDFRSGLPHVETGANVLPVLFSVKDSGDFIEPFMHAWALYTIERGTSADMVWASRSVDAEHYVTAPPPRFHHDAIANRPRSMYSANVWCSNLVQYANTVLENCPQAWEAEWHSYLNDASKRYSYVLVWDAPEPTLAIITQHFPVIHRQGKLTVGKLERAFAGTSVSQ